MDNETEKVSITKYEGDTREVIEDVIVREYPVTLILNNEELVTMLCTPEKFDYLAIGFLMSEGLIASKDEIRLVIVDDIRGVVRVEIKQDNPELKDAIFKRLITSGCGRGASFYNAADVRDRVKIETDLRLTPGQVTSIMKEFQHRSELFKRTGGVHSAALTDGNEILIFSEDIGRHNAIDKIFGECTMKEIPLDDKVVVTSGRISSEILLKVARRKIPILISKSAPTNQGVKLAEELGITVAGFVRGSRMSVYANDWRITVHDG